ncbi:MAG: UDP-galactopyranose mutase [Oscillospiraceae bacterium]|nr:UDP-galactopyranose mutase [Oscillospiraceae bacterium]MCL2278669.1 UDP-galactopyranose mutase [Oscillospiraceae bacterium]
MMKYDFLIVGAGLFGATFAHEATLRGKSCLVIDKRPHIAGNTFTEEIEGIEVHTYGAHIFHTSDKAVWEYVNKFTDFNNYINSPLARFEDELYNLPFNMNTFCQMWGVTTPAEAKNKIESQKLSLDGREPRNLEEQALSLVGHDIYEKLIQGYTEKQWGRSCKDLPPSILKRLPLRFTFDNNYFNDRYQGIPIGGYTEMVRRMLDGSEVILSTDYFEYITKNPNIAETTIYTGAIDEFFDYCYGELEYRSLRFVNEVLSVENFQGNAVVNYTAADIPFTRIIEHKHFEFGTGAKSVITREFPAAWKKGLEPYYPINDEKNNALYDKYKTLARQRRDVHFGGRLGRYAYFDMDKVIADALALAVSVIG